jgi:hypothetical protein
MGNPQAGLGGTGAACARERIETTTMLKIIWLEVKTIEDPSFLYVGSGKWRSVLVSNPAEQVGSVKRCKM